MANFRIVPDKVYYFTIRELTNYWCLVISDDEKLKEISMEISCKGNAPVQSHQNLFVFFFSVPLKIGINALIHLYECMSKLLTGTVHAVLHITYMWIYCTCSIIKKDLTTSCFGSFGVSVTEMAMHGTWKHDLSSNMHKPLRHKEPTIAYIFTDCATFTCSVIRVQLEKIKTDLSFAVLRGFSLCLA